MAPSFATTLAEAGLDDLDRIMRTPDPLLRALPGCGPARLRQLRWARILVPLDSAVSTPGPRPLCTEAEWHAAAPPSPFRPHPQPPRPGAGARP